MNYLSLKLTHYGPPEESLKLIECPEESPGPEEAIVHIDAVGMHIADSLTARGTEALKPESGTFGAPNVAGGGGEAA